MIAPRIKVITGRDFRNYHREHHVAATRETLERDGQRRVQRVETIKSLGLLDPSKSPRVVEKGAGGFHPLLGLSAAVSRALRFATRRRS